MNVTKIFAASVVSLLAVSSESFAGEMFYCTYYYLNQSRSISEQGEFSVDQDVGAEVVYKKHGRNLSFEATSQDDSGLFLAVKDLDKGTPYDALSKIPTGAESGFAMTTEFREGTAPENLFYAGLACSKLADSPIRLP